MPIAIECPQCRRAYRLDDKLAGQKVRCKQCGSAIAVPVAGPPPPAPPGRGSAPSLPAADQEPALPDLRTLFPAAPKSPGVEISIIDETQVKAHRRRWVRQSGNPLLESIDELLKGAVLLALIGGIIVWIIHISRTPQGLSVATAMPLIVVVFVVAAVISPIAAVAVNAAVRTLKLAPRDDTYTRVAACLLLPVAAALLAGWPGLGAALDGLPTVGWVLAPALLIYFFRAELMEWLVSLAAAAAGMGLGLIGAGLAGMLAASVFGPLYGDMLPAGPWSALASGHSPAVSVPHQAVAAESDGSAGGRTSATGPGTTEPASPDVVGGGGAGGNASATQLAADGQQNPPGGPAPGTIPPPATAPRTPRAPATISSPFVSAAVTGDRRLQSVHTFTGSATPNGMLLLARSAQNTETVERWSVDPLEKKGEFAFPFYARRPNAYLLNSRGDVLVALCCFPRNELDVVSFDGKTPRKIFPLETPAGVAIAEPGLVALTEGGSAVVRWDAGGSTGLEIWNTFGTQNQIPHRLALPEAAAPGAETIILSPNGRTLAVYARDDQISLFDVSTPTRLTRIGRIRPTDLSCRFIDMAFSPDGSEIALYSFVADVPTVMSFKVQTGRPVSNTVIPALNGHGREGAEGACNALLWLQIAPARFAWLIDGTLLVDSDSGSKSVSLGLEGVVNQQMAGGDWIALGFRGGGTGDAENLQDMVLAKIDSNKIRDTWDAGRGR